MMPEQMRVPVRSNITAEVLVKGQGESVVFLHGAGGLLWDPFLEMLSQSFKVYAPHHPGTGGSTGASELRDWWDLVLYYYDLFDQLGLDRVKLIGHSFGGMVASELASTDSNRVKKLVLMCSAGLWRDDLPVTDVLSLSLVPDQLYPLLFADLTSPAAQMAMTLPEDPKEQLQLFIERSRALSETGKYLWPIPDKGLSRRIHRLKADTLLIWGQKDGVIPVPYAEEFQRRIPGSEVLVFENAAHYPQLEALPSVLEAVNQFFAREAVVR